MRMFKRGEEADEESIIEPEDENIHGLDKRDPWKMRMFKKEQPWKMRMFKRYPYYDKKSPWKMRMFKRMSTGFGNATYFQRIIFLVSLLAFTYLEELLELKMLQYLFVIYHYLNYLNFIN